MRSRSREFDRVHRETKKNIKKENTKVKLSYELNRKSKVEFEDKYNTEVVDTSPIPEEKEKPNFEPSGLLALETNNKNGIPLKYTEPEESVKPDLDWRLYIFKSNNISKTINLNEKNFYLIGKDEKIVDIILLHPTISKQHAVIQYRKINDQIIPYIIDLNSTNGTYINNEKIETSKYYELKEKDIIKFGYSSREYLLLNNKSN